MQGLEKIFVLTTLPFESKVDKDSLLVVITIEFEMVQLTSPRYTLAIYWLINIVK